MAISANSTDRSRNAASIVYCLSWPCWRPCRLPPRRRFPLRTFPSNLALALVPQIDLETALQWTLQSNPNLVATRQNLNVSAEAVAVAKYFPTSLNPSISVTYTPWVFERQPDGSIADLDRSVSVTWAQPIELGHRQAYRQQMARASYSQTQWTFLQAELAALIQTYRLHQTALYRREKASVAQDLNNFSMRLVETLRRQAEANQATAADVVLAEVENQATVDQLEAARQDYVAALADLRQQIGIPGVAASAEPTGELRVPEDKLSGSGASGDVRRQALVRSAQEARPEVQLPRGRGGQLAGGPRSGPRRPDPRALARPGL